MSDHIAKAYDEDLVAAEDACWRRWAASSSSSSTTPSTRCRAATPRWPTASSRTTRRIDVLERQIEEKAILTIAKRQPMARDLREIMVAIRVASDLERIGDLAKNTAKRAHAMSESRCRAS